MKKPQRAVSDVINWESVPPPPQSSPSSTAQRNPIEGQKKAARGLGKPGESCGGEEQGGQWAPRPN